MSKRRLAWVFAISLPAMLALLWPLRLVLDASGFDAYRLSAKDVTGSIWNGRLRDAAVRGLPQGDLSVRLRPFSLLTGARRLHLANGTLSGTITTGRVQGVEHASGELTLERIESLPGLGLSLLLEDASLTFADGRCRDAGGVIDVAVHLATADDATAPIRLAGRPVCEERTGIVQLAPIAGGAPGVPRVEATLRIEANGDYQLQSLVQAGDDTTRALLLLAGFQESPSGMSRIDRGALVD
ncbi:MAG: type II secretion system protein N [Lysobacter sp.]